ncbi:MAG: hypothetical protein ABIT38_20165 [Gemmatimonadaceae bacterium]
MMSLNSRSLIVAAVLLAGSAVAPASLHAQQGIPSTRPDSSAIALPSVTTFGTVPTAPASPRAGMRSAPAGINLATTHAPFVVGQPAGDAHIGAGSNIALMGVGAAAIVVGLLIGGNGGYAIAVGGGVIGLLGLYRYLQ